MKVYRCKPAILLLLLFLLATAVPAGAATTEMVTATPTFPPDAGNVTLGQIWIFENSDQAKSTFLQSPPGTPMMITVTILTGGVRFQATPAVDAGVGLVDVVDPLGTIATNTIAPGDLQMLGSPNTQTYTLQVTPSYPPGSTRGGLQFMFPVNISGAPAGPVEIDVSAPGTGIASQRFTISGQAPVNAPNLLAASAVSDSQINLAWMDNSNNESGFKIERKEGSGSYQEIASVGEGVTSYQDKGLAPEVTYSYRVRAMSGSVYTDYTKEVSAQTKSKSTPEVKEKEQVVRFYIDSSSYYKDDVQAAMDAKPAIIDGRIFVPARYFAETSGAVVGWEPTEQRVEINGTGKNLKIWIGNNQALLNGTFKEIEPGNPNVTPFISETGRVMVPVRFLAESLGAQVIWNEATKEVKIITKT